MFNNENFEIDIGEATQKNKFPFETKLSNIQVKITFSFICLHFVNGK